MISDSKISERVSIIMPAYNCERFIAEAIQSVLDQTYKNWELIICDDGSIDRTRLIADEFASKDNRVTVLSNKFLKGASGARNTALEEAQGRFIAFLDCDDLWEPQKLKAHIGAMKSNKWVMTHSDYKLIDEHGKDLFLHMRTPNLINLSRLRCANFLPCLTVVYDSQFFGKVAQPDLKRRNDYALWLKIFTSRPNSCSERVGGVLATYRSNSYGLSSNKLKALYYNWRALVEYGGLGPFGAGFRCCLYIVLILLKKRAPGAYNYLIIRNFRRY